MKKRIQFLWESITIGSIPVVLCAVLFFVSFHSCQKDEIAVNANNEASIDQQGLLKNGTISAALINTMILRIEDYVSTGDLEAGIANALISKLENAKKNLERGNENAAMNQLQAVINQLESLVSENTIDDAIGNALIFDAKVITGECTSCGLPFTDPRDGRVYKTIMIGDQCWMSENLAYQTETGSWAHNNDESNVETYGRLYTWDTALTACPPGWHLPSEAEWNVLEKFLTDNHYAWTDATYPSEIAKSMAANLNWEASTIPGSPGYDMTTNNSCGFSGKPGGVRIETGYFFPTGREGFFWSTFLDQDNTTAWGRRLSNYSTFLNKVGNDRVRGQSVRCVRN